MFEPGKFYHFQDLVWMALTAERLVTFNGNEHRFHDEMLNWSGLKYRRFFTGNSDEPEPEFGEILKLWNTDSATVDKVTGPYFYSEPEDCHRVRNLIDYETLDKTFRVFFDNWQEHIR